MTTTRTVVALLLLGILLSPALPATAQDAPKAFKPEELEQHEEENQQRRTERRSSPRDRSPPIDQILPAHDRRQDEELKRQRRQPGGRRLDHEPVPLHLGSGETVSTTAGGSHGSSGRGGGAPVNPD